MKRSDPLNMDLFAWISPDTLQPALAAFDSELLLAAIVFMATAILFALCVPGVLIPIAISSGALLGAWEAAGVVALGAVAGSQLVFVTTRQFAGDRLRARFGTRIEAFELRFAAHGFSYLILLRLLGAPHLLVTAGSAASRVRAATFAAATLIGLLPVISLAAAGGSAI